MYLTRPCHRPEFLREHHLGVEAHIGRYDRLPDWPQYIPFVFGVHLPYAGLNLAANDEPTREHSLQQLKLALDEGCQYPVDRMVIHTVGYETMEGVSVGSYDHMVSSLQKLADYAAEKQIILCIENQVLREERLCKVYGSNAAEWLQIRQDVDRENVLLTLDSSHAATSVAIYENAVERAERMFDFLQYPDWIGRVHWSDSRITNNESRFNDMHLVPGQGDLPRAFHQAIKQLPVTKLLEQRCPEEEVIAGLKFIESL